MVDHSSDLANKANYTGHGKFLNAGYEMIITNDTYKGGVVKQFEHFSFSRVFQAGHAVNAYQPETVWRIFSRTVAGKDVATGKEQINAGYSSAGPQSSWNMVQQKLSDAPPTCMVLGAFQDKSPWILLSESDGTDANRSSNGNGTARGPQISEASVGRMSGILCATLTLLAMGVAL